MLRIKSKKVALKQKEWLRKHTKTHAWSPQTKRGGFPFSFKEMEKVNTSNRKMKEINETEVVNDNKVLRQGSRQMKEGKTEVMVWLGEEVLVNKEMEDIRQKS